MRAIKLYRLSRWLYTKGVPFLPTFITKLIYLLYNCYIPASCSIGKGTVLGYGGIGVVIHGRAIIGCNCVIASGVTIGGRSKIPDVPVIGDFVYVGTGSKVLGNVTVGSQSVIGANAVVISDVPEGSVVAGVPAKVIRSGIKMEDYV